MIRVNVVAEGQSEMGFAKKLLNEYFGGQPIIDSRCVLTSRNQKTNYEYRGGLVKYQHAKNDIVRWLKEDVNAYVTTMFDFFRLPDDFPEYAYAKVSSFFRMGWKIAISLRIIIPQRIFTSSARPILCLAELFQLHD